MTPALLLRILDLRPFRLALAFGVLLLSVGVWSGGLSRAAGDTNRSAPIGYEEAEEGAHALAAWSASVKVARAPLLERLSVSSHVALPAFSAQEVAVTAETAHDRRRELRRVEPRRRVPRLNCEEPPWA